MTHTRYVHVTECSVLLFVLTHVFVQAIRECAADDQASAAAVKEAIQLGKSITQDDPQYELIQKQLAKIVSRTKPKRARPKKATTPGVQPTKTNAGKSSLVTSKPKIAVNGTRGARDIESQQYTRDMLS
jgi:hypothetical protein